MDTFPFPRACWKPAEPSDRGFLSMWQLGTWWCYARNIFSQLYVFCHPLLQEGGMPALSCLCRSSRSSSWLPSSPLLVWSAGGWWSLGPWEWLGAVSVTCSWTARSCTVQVRKRGLDVPDTHQAHRSQLGRLRTLAEGQIPSWCETPYWRSPVKTCCVASVENLIQNTLPPHWCKLEKILLKGEVSAGMLCVNKTRTKTRLADLFNLCI